MIRGHEGTPWRGPAKGSPKKPPLVVTWRNLFLSDKGPPMANTRYVLLYLSVCMREDGSRCFEGQRTDVPPGRVPLPMLDLEPSVVQEVGAF